jgi:hypothetical protein
VKKSRRRDKVQIILPAPTQNDRRRYRQGWQRESRTKKYNGEGNIGGKETQALQK